MQGADKTTWITRLTSIRLGITAHLILSFSLVAVLAAAANLIAEHGAEVIQAAKTARAAAAKVTPSQSATQTPLSQRSEPHQQVSISTEALITAIYRFEQAVKARAEVNAPEKSEQLQNASDALKQESAVVINGANQLQGKSLPGVHNAINLYIQTGNDLVRVADARYASLNSLTNRLENMNARVKSSLDSAWKIFGRVIARQSLLQLSTGLDEIRRSITTLNDVDGDHAAALSQLRDSEVAFEKLLESNAKSFARADGAQWLLAMREDYAQMIAAQNSALQFDLELRSLAERFATARAALIKRIPKQLNAPAPQDAPASLDLAAQVTSPVAPRPEPSAAATPEGATPVSDDATPAAVASAKGALKSNNHRLVQTISVAVLLSLLLISGVTVRSIVVPVRRLIRSTQKIARGEMSVTLPRGGIKELDLLAVAFNQMTERLHAAQETTRLQQQQLEATVAERTQQLQQLSERDPLTKLPNRRYLSMLMDSSLNLAAQNNRHMGLYFVDVDNFKNINDSMGHAFGDQVLTAIGQRLNANAAAFGFAARLGGDEFTVIYADASQAADIEAAGQRLVQAFHEPLLLDGRALHVSVSIGVSIYPNHALTPDALLRAADAALFRAKALGRSQLSMFTSELLEQAASKFSTEQGLRRALDHDEFELWFQPELCLESLQVRTVEALIRWRLPDGRLAAPGEFLAVAEESGLINEISEWVFRCAIATAASWHHGAWPEIRMAINVSPRQLLDQQFATKLEALLHEYSLPPHCIEIELTENVLQTGPNTIATLQQLRAHGIAIALDDFGTGYSSLSSIEQLPLTRVKIDRSLVDTIDTNPRSAAIVRAIIGLCHGLGLHVTAEGIERVEQFDFFRGYPDIYLQGYLLSRPMPATQVLGTLPIVSQRAEQWILTRKTDATSNVVEIQPARRKLTNTPHGD